MVWRPSLTTWTSRIVFPRVRVLVEEVYSRTNDWAHFGVHRNGTNQDGVTVISHAARPRISIAWETLSASVVADIVFSAYPVCGVYRIFVVAVLVEFGVVRCKMPTGPVRSAPPSVDRYLPRWVSEIDRISLHIIVEIDSAIEPYRVLANETTNTRVVIPGAVEVQIGFGVEFTPR